MDFSKVAIGIPEILLPGATVDLYRWAVVACDQFTSEPEYWKKAADIVGGAPSTLELVFPEVYLGKGNDRERIERINRMIRVYLDRGILTSVGPGMIYIERRTSRGNIRKGLIVAADLECYDYRRGSRSLIRATEGTVLERIPPRVQIREQALLELPHIMLLVDDPGMRVIEPLAEIRDEMPRLYDTDLMLGGGHLTGYRVAEPETLQRICREITALAQPDAFNRRYGTSGKEPLLFAAGDGNHSLATAKAVWEKLKQQPGIDPENHPARYALVEIVNLHDPGLQFEPIHRILFGVNGERMLREMEAAWVGCGFAIEWINRPETLADRLRENGAEPRGGHRFGFVTEKNTGIVKVAEPRHNLAVGTLQEFLDRWLKDHPEVEIDYVHGEAVLRELGAKPGNIGFFLPPLAKDSLFKTVILDGVLPRKTFSMGEAEEKRYYMECRRIR
jgi:uncharacterized protein (DUF1015 family)